MSTRVLFFAEVVLAGAEGLHLSQDDVADLLKVPHPHDLWCKGMLLRPLLCTWAQRISVSFLLSGILWRMDPVVPTVADAEDADEEYFYYDEASIEPDLEAVPSGPLPSGPPINQSRSQHAHPAAGTDNWSSFAGNQCDCIQASSLGRRGEEPVFSHSIFLLPTCSLVPVWHMDPVIFER